MQYVVQKLLNYSDNTMKIVSAAAATVLAAYIAYTIIVPKNPFARLPKSTYDGDASYMYDPSKREEGTDQVFPACEKTTAAAQVALLVNDVNLAHEILLRQDRYKPGHVYGRSPMISQFHTLLLGGDNIGNSRGEDWRMRRDKLVPPFQGRILVPELLPFVIKKAEEMIEEIKAHSDEPVDMDYYFVKLTGDIISDYLFGESPQPGEVTFNNMSNPAFALIVIKLKRYLEFFGIKDAGSAEIQKNTRFVQRVIEKVKRGEGKRSNGSPSLAERLLQYEEYQGPEGEARLTQDLLFMMFAGHDTTAHTLTILSYVLSQEQECREKIQQEVETYVPTTADMTAANLAKLKYTSAAIKESLRLHPVLSWILVHAYEDSVLGDVVVPEGTTIVIPTVRVQRDPTVFKKPLAYMPERWMQEDLQLHQDLEKLGTDKSELSKAFIAFSAGTHSCLGMNLAYLELRVVTALLVQNFDWEYNGPALHTTGLLLRVKERVMLKFAPRTT